MFLRECYWTEIMDENEKRFYGFTQNPIKLENEIKNEPGIQNHPRNERNIYLPPTYFAPVDTNAFSYNEPPKCPPQWPPRWPANGPGNRATQNLLPQQHTLTPYYSPKVGKRFGPPPPTNNAPPKRNAFSYNEPPNGPPQWSTTIGHWPAERATQIEPPKPATQNEPLWAPIANKPKKRKKLNIVNKEKFAEFMYNTFVRHHVPEIEVDELKRRILAAQKQLTFVTEYSYHRYLDWYINENRGVISKAGKKCKLH